MIQQIVALLKRPFEDIVLKDVLFLSGGFVIVALAAFLTYRILQILERFLERRKKPSRAVLFRLIRTPAVFTVLIGCLILLGDLWGEERISPRLVEVSRFLLWLSVFWGLIRLMEYAILQRLLYEHHGVRMPKLFHDIIVLTLYAIVVLSLLRVFFDVNLTLLLTTSAVFSLILGLALQDTLSNLLAGLALHFEGTIHLGQWIGVGEWEGEISGITWRSIKVRTFEGDYVIIPNSTIAKSELTNYSQPTPLHVQKLGIGVSYECPPGKLKRVCLEVLRKVDGVLPMPAPEVRLIDYSDFSINYEMRFWIREYSQYRTIRNEVYSLLWYHFKREGIVIPFPIRTLDIPWRKQRLDEKERGALVEKLKRIDFLAILNDEQLSMVQGGVRPLTFTAGEVVIEQGLPNSTFYIIEEGEVEVSVKTEMGRKQVVSTIGPGGYFGEYSLFAGDPANATITALKDTVALTLNQSTFEEILRADAGVAELISRRIGERAAGRTEALANSAEIAAQAAQPAASEDQVQEYATRLLKKIYRLFKL